jgi:hypothetical protein
MYASMRGELQIVYLPVLKKKFSGGFEMRKTSKKALHHRESREFLCLTPPMIIKSYIYRESHSVTEEKKGKRGNRLSFLTHQ